MSCGNPETHEAAGGVTVRALAIGIALCPLNAYWLIQTEMIWWSGFPTTVSLFYNVTFIVLLLALAGLALRRRWPRAALAPGELMTVYIFLCFTSVLCSVDFLEVLIPLIAHPRWYASPENRWDEVFFGTPEAPGPVPRWLIVDDVEVLRGFHEGHSSMYRWEVLRAWAGPLFWWSTFILALLAAVVLITTVFRRQWTERERLSYPVIQIPLQIATNLPALLRSKLFWWGFGIAAGVDLLNGWHKINPLVPGIPLVQAFNFKDYLTSPPWDAIGPTFISVHLFAIGMSYFLPTDLIFSCWFFFLFYRTEEVLARASGVHGMPGFPFIVEQSAGGYFGLCAIALWVSRRHLLAVTRTVLGRPGGLDDRDEPVRYRRAVLLLALCTGYLVAFGMAAGASWWVMLLAFAIFYAYSIAIARMRAELGPPAHDLHRAGPGQLLSQALGTHGTGGGNLAVLSMFYFFNRAYRSHAAPHAIEGFKIAERLSMSPRRLLGVMAAAIVCGLFITYWALLHNLYIHGVSGTSAAPLGSESWNQLAGWLQSPQKPNLAASLAVGAGFLFSAFLAFMRLTFAWWPFHPVGYATSSTWSMWHLWFSMFVAWTVKSVLLRYGGARIYRPAMPFFVGLVLGEFVVGSLWTIYGVTFGVPVYRFWG